MRNFRRHPQKGRHAFTLVELLVSMTILSVLIVALTSILANSLSSWTKAESRFNQFRESQAAFESMSARLQGAILDPYLDYEYPGGDKSKTPLRYVRESNLHFVSGPASGGEAGASMFGRGTASITHAIFFHGAFGNHETREWDGLGNLVNSWGYFIEYDDNSSKRPDFLAAEGDIPIQPRFRLKEFQVPAEDVSTFSDQLGKATNANELYNWFRSNIEEGKVHTLAENIIALVISPLEPDPIDGVSTELAPTYTYDSRAYQHLAFPNEILETTRHRLPPLLRITLVALDDTSAARLSEDSPSTAPDLGLNSLFRIADDYEDDLATLEQTLLDKNLNYRVFSTTIRIRNAKWSHTD